MQLKLALKTKTMEKLLVEECTNTAPESLPDKNPSIISHIYGNIFIANKEYISTHPEQQTSLIVNCVSHKLPSDADCKGYLNLQMQDRAEYDVLYDLYRFIDFVDEFAEKIIVHCRSGKSRSGTLVIGYLMWKLKIDDTKAYEMV